MKKLLLVVLALALFVGANAQVKFGAKAGLNLANVSGDVEDNSMKIGMQLGAVVDFSFSDALSLQPGVLFSQKGFKVKDQGSVNVNYLEIPINLVYGLEMGDNALQFFAGPYVGIGIGAKMKPDEGDDIDIEFVNDYVDADGPAAIKRLDFGLNFGAGYKIGAIQIQAGYGLGLANLEPDWDGEKPDDKMTNAVIQFSVAYFFGN